MRVVLDTNVLIAALITRGVCSDLLEHCFRRHEIVLSEFILDEFRRHLYRFGYTSAEVGEAEELLRWKATVVVPVPLEPSVCRDADDVMVLGTAVAGEATCVITGDKDLLVLRQFGSVKILSPADFLAQETDSDNQSRRR